MVPSDRGVSTKSNRLQQKQIALVICGGIGAVETVKIAREFRRYQAEIIAYFTPAALKFVTPLALSWATGNRVHDETDAWVEHLDPVDAVIVAPATLNTIVKASLGLCDNVGLLRIASQIGARKPVVIFPTMNEVLLQHPRFLAAKGILSDWGCFFNESQLEEGRLKMPSPDVFVESVCNHLGW